MTDEQIETILGDFRGWLREHGDQPPPLGDALALVNEFTALRHEVKLLTKATRGQSEQVAAALAELTENQPDTSDAVEIDDGELRPVLSAVLEVADTVDRAVVAVQRLADEPPPKQSMLQRMVGRSATSDNNDKLAALADGLRLSQQRLTAALRRMELEPVPAMGESFDPESMEALEAVACDDSSGVVLEEVRTGYHWRGKVFRYAQVKVAK